MKIKDIVNRDIVNLTNCEFEPIHIPGSIQPHGFLLGINIHSWKIDFCSGNIQDYIPSTHQAILGNEFKAIFGEKKEALIKDYIKKNALLSSSPLKLKLLGYPFLCTVHKSNEIYILEAESAKENSKKVADVYDQTSQFLSYMNSTHTLKELCEMVVKGIREITGYDRVMVYRFDKDYNGEVFAESVREDLEPFLELHYPHTDIPVQARELYMKNLLRLIVDINYTPVPLYTVDNGEDRNLDLSLSILRSTSPIHVQYLQNMGVGATLTISLIHKDKLWGLIACHHYSEKNLTPEIRLAAQLQGHFITSQIDIRQSNEEYEIARKSNIALEKLNALHLSANEDAFKTVVQNENLLATCNASGVAIVFNNTIYKNGLTPDDRNINKLIKWLSVFTNNGTFSTEKLLDFLPDVNDYCEEASGILYHSLSTENDDCIIWFRPESLTEINWAGDPNKAIVKDANGLYPRNSFKLYKEIVKCQSKLWLQPELNAGANYAHTLQKQFNLLIISQEEEKYRKLSELLKETNSELENINWISTHDLQEPLRKIQMLSSRLLGKEDEQFSETVINSVQRMNNSAKRMQTLLIDILKYTKIQHINDSFETVDPHDVLVEVLSDLNEMINEKQAIIQIETLPQITGIPFLMKQLFTNLIQNSLKYSFPDKTPIVKIKSLGICELNSNSFEVLEFSDNGIGFEQQFAENIFNIFSRLHSQEAYKGSGVGLALCKKIMQVHKGSITAEGIENQGAKFKLYFPLNHE
ncbi:light-regulated signal transduction histidine kinase (bacteriophytochrome) [Flavobacterium arsenatis]|uniref:histidine kinase n=1 Tax=Flavobacterium arsenatis TaxID=1484332 RepID=A0ABU1TRC7_9FLAO|nr:ATP-binding protein [Flavobacterium arsenatis]MDR6968422.1 light-regulated signal transduction histidine kinase (bacteriophytochrome) [Flavobacterium arsenatis]